MKLFVIAVLATNIMSQFGGANHSICEPTGAVLCRLSAGINARRD